MKSRFFFHFMRIGEPGTHSPIVVGKRNEEEEASDGEENQYLQNPIFKSGWTARRDSYYAGQRGTT